MNFESIDIDSNFYSLGTAQNLNDENFDSAKFNEVYSGNCVEDLKIFHLNIRSFPRNVNSLHTYLGTINQKFDVICLSETWLNEGRFIENCFLDYNHFYSKRPANKPFGGGCAIFVNKKFNCSELIHLSCNLEHIECVFVEISYQNKKIINGCCYRPPTSNNASNFIDDLIFKISQIPSYTPILLAGDFNFNLLRVHDDTDASSFLDSMLSVGLINTITTPTRDFNNSASLIDNIFISSSLFYTSGVFQWDISDHFAIFSFIKNIFSTQNEVEYVSYRLINEGTISELVNAISNIDFSNILNSDDIDFSINTLDSVILDQYNIHCPIICKKLTRKDREKPWITNSLKSLIFARQAYYRWFRSGIISHECYRGFRNHVTNRLKIAKKNYFHNLLEQARNNMRKIWNILNGLIRPDYNSKKRKINSLIVDGETIDNNNDISNVLNQHFSTIGSTISEEFENVNHSIISLNQIQNSLFFRNVLPSDITSIIDNMENKPSPIHNYSVRIMKEIKDLIAPILSHIINKSLQQGYFPTKLKLARVIPLHKGGSSENVNNFRPISILPLLSKIFERTAYNQLYNFLEKYNILTPYQYGFRKNRSTIQAVLNQLEFIYKNLDQKKTVISIFMDFSKAFDSIDHEILLKKLYFYGVRGIPHDWFSSYLSNRKQFVNVNDTNSSVKYVSHGVPQGSILGPLLFLIFINDLPNVSPFFKFCIFADDSTLTCKFDNSDESQMKNKLENELVVIHNWLIMNKIKINYDKSKFIIFSYGKKYSLEQIKIGSSFISSTDNTKFLGIWVDNHLNFRSHIDSISSKISKVVGMLFRLNDILPKEALKTLYSTLLLPHLMYGIEIWYGILKSNDDRIFKLQKKSIRAINCLPYAAHTNDYFKSMNLLKLEDIYKQRVLLYMYKSDLTSIHEANHNYATRHAYDIVLPLFSRSKTQCTIFYKGIILWNNLPEEIKAKRTENTFKYYLKNMYIDTY